jgi:DNA-binding winged helix-turn-helix (wHTH) protein/TolB-like protein/tetratricopeptide (TPR) repeat protein
VRRNFVETWSKPVHQRVQTGRRFMTEGNSGSDSTLRFGAFVLDASRALLTRDGTPVPLRPKTFAMLSYLARHPGRVLGKQELLAAVWPGVVVNDESLSQCVRELRAALGDDRQALIRTVPRRGYRFDAAPGVATAGAAASIAPKPRRRWHLAGLAGVALAVAVAAGWALQRMRDPIDPLVDTRRSIAVLPFTEADSQAGSVFGEGLAEDLSHHLGRRPALLVMAVASSAAVAEREADLGRVGRMLGVQHLVAGTVQRDAQAVNVSARLVSAHDGAVLWSGQFRYAGMADWAWQRDIGSAVAHALDLPADAAAPAGTLDDHRLGAFDANLKGRHHLRHFATLADLRQARVHFEQALAIDPASARAQVGLAWTHLVEIERGWSKDRHEQVGQAERAIARALEAAPEHPLTLRLKPGLASVRGDLDAALAGYLAAVADNPSSAWDQARIASLKVRLGRPEEAIVHADMALRLSPFEPTLVGYSHLWAGIAEFYLDRETAAYERMRQSLAAGRHPARLNALYWLASLAALQGNQAQAQQHAAEVMQLAPGYTVARWRSSAVFTHPRLVAGRERFAEGMKKAGIPE